MRQKRAYVAKLANDGGSVDKGSSGQTRQPRYADGDRRSLQRSSELDNTLLLAEAQAGQGEGDQHAKARGSGVCRPAALSNPEKRTAECQPSSGDAKKGRHREEIV